MSMPAFPDFRRPAAPVQDTLPGTPDPTQDRTGAATPNFQRNSQPGPQRFGAPRANKFGGKCGKCGSYVQENAGVLTGGRGNWGVEHKPGECPSADAPAPAERTVSNPGAFPVPDGRYTVIWENHYKTMRVQTQDEFATFMPGKVVLKYLSGSNNDHDYTSFAHVDEHGNVRVWKKFQDRADLREAVKVLMGDPKAASKAYAAESGQCGRCGRTLTTPESLSAGIGPECASKLGW